MKVSLTPLKYLLVINAALMGVLLLKPLFVPPAHAQEARSARLPGTYQVVVSGASVIIMDTRDGTLKLLENGKVVSAHWDTNYKEIFQAGK